MIRIKQIMAIARAETRITRRLVRYWVFLGLSYLIALIAYFYYSFLHGFYSSYSASVGLISPHFLVTVVGIYYLLIYVIGAVFLAFDVRARDKRERMIEVLDSRPYTNLELVVGRFLGILIPSWVPMLILAILMELIGLLLVTLRAPLGEPVEVVSLFGFAVVMGIPAVSFALSLVFLLTLLVRNRLVAAVLLLILLGSAYWAIYTLPLNYGRVFDFFGIMYIGFPSDILPGLTDGVGFIQRLGVLLAAFGLLGLSAAIHPRLDGSSRIKPVFCSSLVFIMALALIGFCYQKYSNDIKMSEIWMAAHTARMHSPVPDVQSISGEVRIVPGKALELDIDLTFRAPDQEPLKSAIFTLNPGQEVEKALDDSGHSLKFSHENGLLEFTLPQPLGPGEEAKIHLLIKGIPDRRFAYLESAINMETIKLNKTGNMGLLGYEKAIFDSRFVALMPCVRWLPASGAEKGRDDPRNRPVDYFNVDLSVDIPGDWLVAGPGRRHNVEGNNGDKRFRFAPPAPVPEVALIASRFENRSVEVEGVLMEMLIHKKHVKNLETIAETNELVQNWIRDRLLEAKDYGLSYPYDGLALVEVPTKLRAFGGGWRLDTALTAPGLLMMREMSLPTARFDTAFRKPEQFKDREGGITQAKFERLKAFFLNDFSGGNIFSGVARDFFVYQTNARGPEGLALNFVMETLSTLLITETKGYFSAHVYATGNRINQIINTVITNYFVNRQRGNTVADATISVLTSRPEVWDQALGVALKDMDPWEDPARTVDVLTLKGNAISQSILDILGHENTGRLLSSLREAHRGQSYTLDDMLEAGKALGYDLEGLLGDWLGSTALPGFVIDNTDIYRLPDSEDGNPRYQLLITVRNDESAPGVFRFVYLYSGQGGDNEWVNSKPIQLAGKSTVRFGTVLSRPPSVEFLDPYLSLNRTEFMVPIVSLDPRKIEKKEAIEGLEELPWSLPKEDFIVVDDLDPGFKVVKGEQGNGFRLNVREKESEVTDQGLPVAPFNRVPATWSRKTSSTDYGKYRHTMAVIKAGKGEDKAVFTTSIPRAGPWDLELYLPFKPTFPGSKWGTWNLVIKDSHSDQYDIKFDSNAAGMGWTLAGSFDFPEGEVSVTLSNKTDGQLVVADAIRWSPSAENKGK